MDDFVFVRAEQVIEIKMFELKYSWNILKFYVEVSVLVAF